MSAAQINRLNGAYLTALHDARNRLMDADPSYHPGPMEPSVGLIQYRLRNGLDVVDGSVIDREAE